MVTVMGLHDTLCDFLQKEIAPLFKLKTNKRDGTETIREPQIVRSGIIMPRSIDSGDGDLYEEFPYIMPRLGKIENSKNVREIIVSMSVFFGVYDPGVYDENGVLVDDGSGYRDFWNLIEATRLALFQAQVMEYIFRRYRQA